MTFLQKSNPKAAKEQTSPILAYRVWRMDRAAGELWSCANRTVWPKRRRIVRDEIYDAGIHAAKEASQTIQLWREYTGDAAGSVYLWGEVQEFTQGYTAEFAYPKELWMPEDTDPTLVLKLEDNYGVPVRLRAEFQKLVIAPAYAPAVPTVADPAGLLAYGTVGQASLLKTQQMLYTQLRPMQAQYAQSVQYALGQQQGLLPAMISGTYTSLSNVYPGGLIDIP
jgi:hypothetical protein